MGHLLLIVLFILFEGYFSGSETGAYSLNGIRLHHRVEEKSRSALILHRLLCDPRGLICTILIGTNLCVYISTDPLTSQLKQFGVPAAALVSTICLSPVLPVFGEATPKSIFQANADFLMYKLAPSLAFFKRLFWPGVWALKRITGLFSTPVAGLDTRAPFSAARLGYFFDQGEKAGVLTPYQRSMARNVMKLGRISADAAMIPLANVVVVPKSLSKEALLDLATKRRYTRLPVYDERPDRIIGVLNWLDVFCADDGRRIEDLMRPPITIPRAMSIHDALLVLQRASYPMGVVLDETGNAAGIVTMKDLVEEIVGELEVW